MYRSTFCKGEPRAGRDSRELMGAHTVRLPGGLEHLRGFTLGISVTWFQAIILSGRIATLTDRKCPFARQRLQSGR